MLIVYNAENDALVGRWLRGESVFVPRTVAHSWGSPGEVPATVLEVYQPAGRMEQFFRELGEFTDTPPHEAMSVEELVRWFDAHGMCLLPPPGYGGDEPAGDAVPSG